MRQSADGDFTPLGTQDGLGAVEQAAADLAEVAAGDRAYLVIGKLSTLAGRDLTQAELSYWTEIVRRAAGLPGRRDRLLAFEDVDTEDLDGGATVIEADRNGHPFTLGE
jgi:hypothetical protein